MSNISKRQKIKEWLEKEVVKNSKMIEEKNNLETNGIKIKKESLYIEVKGSGKSFEVSFNQKVEVGTTKSFNKKSGVFEMNCKSSKNQIQIGNLVFENEEVMKQKIRRLESPESRRAMEESLKELQRKNKKEIKTIEEKMNEELKIYISNSHKRFMQIVESLNSRLKEILGDVFLTKERRLKKIKRNVIVKSMINLSRDSAEQRVFKDIKKTYIEIFKKNGSMMGLDPKNFVRFIMQMTLIMKEIAILDKSIKGLKKIKKIVKINFEDTVEHKLEELIDMIRKDEDEVEDIIQKLNPKALLRSMDLELNKLYRIEEVYID